MPVVTALFRYPVKGLSPEALGKAALVPDQGIPGDRQFAIAHGTTSFDPAAPKYLPKAHFLMLMRNGALAALRTAFDASTGVLTIRQPDGDGVSGNLNEPAGRAAIEDFMGAYLGAEVRGRPKVVTAPGHMFSDVAAKVVSLINLASVRDIEARAGQKVELLLDGKPVEKVSSDGSKTSASRTWAVSLWRGLPLERLGHFRPHARCLDGYLG